MSPQITQILLIGYLCQSSIFHNLDDREIQHSNVLGFHCHHHHHHHQRDDHHIVKANIMIMMISNSLFTDSESEQEWPPPRNATQQVLLTIRLFHLQIYNPVLLIFYKYRAGLFHLDCLQIHKYGAGAFIPVVQKCTYTKQSKHLKGI